MVTYLFIALLIAIIIWRVILPGMKLESGKASATGDPTASVTPPAPKTGWRKWVDDNWWKVLLVIIVTATIVWGLKSTFGTSSGPGTWSSVLQPTPEGVWKFFKDYWLWMILALAILFFASNALPDSWAKAAKGLVVVIVVTLVGAMAVYGIWGESSSSSQQAQLVCAPISDTEVHRCVLTERPTIFTTERLVYSEVLEFCIVRQTGGLFESKKIGPNTFEVRSISGALPIEYKALRGPCPDKF